MRLHSIYTFTNFIQAIYIITTFLNMIPISMFSTFFSSCKTFYVRRFVAALDLDHVSYSALPAKTSQQQEGCCTTTKCHYRLRVDLSLEVANGTGGDI